MAKLRKFAAYQTLERPYTRISKFSKKNFVRGGRPNSKIVKFEMGNNKKEFSSTFQLKSKEDMNVRHNALEAARLTSNKTLETAAGRSEYSLIIKVYPHHVLRNNPLASGAGADRMSTGMKKSYGKSISTAARVKSGQTLIEVKVDEKFRDVAKKALAKAGHKFPCACKVVRVD
jgi:large subunit ribosomal protein L10e